LVFRYPSLPSTNDEATRLVRTQRPPEFSVVLALDQTAGRGQASNTWKSEPGANLTCSFILYPRFSQPERAFLLNMAMALAAADCVSALCSGELHIAPAIKWPNDILLSDLKVAGILLENIWQGQRWDACVAGIGLNLNQTDFSGIDGAASLHSLSGQTFERDYVLSQLQQAVKARYRQWELRPDEILADYNVRLWRRGEYSAYMKEDGTYLNLKLDSVDARGLAVTTDLTGAREAYPHGKIRQLR
jgi:BirA family biotin operon repressor/biotin-[acetyl-CoA-carboxylase] ligase